MKCEVCGVCKVNEPNEYSTMCDSCIDDGWRRDSNWSKTGYVNLKHLPARFTKHKDFIDASRIKTRGSKK